jgi:hypothetical protein
MKSFSDLRFFCHYIVNKYGSPHSASEEDKAAEFRKVYLRDQPSKLRTLKAIASACGIHVNSLDGKRFPLNMRGFHDVFEGDRNIYYKEGDTISGIENTILHEFREMIEPVFAELCPGYEPLDDVHVAANMFAAAVLLPRDEFREKVYETGFDVVALSGLYSKSCSQVLLRMGEVLQGKLFFYGALYESIDSPGSDWRVTYWTESRNEDFLEANVNGAGWLFPRKGTAVVPGSLVDMAIEGKRPHLARRITLLDDMDDEGLAALASPLIISGLPARVALVVLLDENRELLAPQIRRLKPKTVDGFHRHL